MGRLNTADGAVEDLGVLLAAALDLDRTWMASAPCRRWRYDDDPDGEALRPSPWHLSPGDRHPIDEKATAFEVVKVALMICMGCKVQWDCARYAVRGQMRAGTWAMPITTLREVSRKKNVETFLSVVDAAEEKGVPVQVAARAFRPDADTSRM